MEESVVDGLMSGPLGSLFDIRQKLTDVSGSGNNWAHGFGHYGPKYHDNLLDNIRRSVEACDALEAFSFTHSLGGGTGSGLGSYLLQQVADEYPSSIRLSTVVAPSAFGDDVVTSPYNSMLSLLYLTEHSSCINLASNESLSRIARAQAKGGFGPAETEEDFGADGDVGYDSMNNIVALVLMHLTASVRFEGELNTDLNEIATNLVPFPNTQFLIPSVAPLPIPADKGQIQNRSLASRRNSVGSKTFISLHARMKELTDRRRWLVSPVSPFQLNRNGIPTANSESNNAAQQAPALAAAVLARGSVDLSELSDEVRGLRQDLKLAPFNAESVKIGVSNFQPSTSGAGTGSAGLLLLQNSTLAADVLSDTVAGRFDKLWKRRAHMHHYKEYLGDDTEELMNRARENLKKVKDAYSKALISNGSDERRGMSDGRLKYVRSLKRPLI